MLLRQFDGSWTKRAWQGAITLGLAVIAVGMVGFGTPAAAQQNLIQNGGFETVPTGVTNGYQIGVPLAANSTASNALPDWATANGPSSSGIGCMEYGANTGHLLCGPNYGSPASTFATYPGQSPNGGNSIALDAGNGYQMSVSQLVSGLTIGKAYTLTFYQAASQQAGFAGVTSSDFWVVSFGGSAGTTTTDSTAMSLVVQGDVPWEQQTMNFVANATSETLTFLTDNATGTSADPPFIFLDGVNLVQAPEPASVGLMGLGILTLGALRRRRARRLAGLPVSIALEETAAVH
jgi:PEP-CTERM motif